MRWKSLFALALLFGGLVALWRLRAEERREEGAVQAAFPLLPGYEARRVQAFGVDHLRRAVQVRLERDAAGTWFLTDPIAYPAETGVVRLLLDTLTTATGVPAGDVDLEAVGLEPPVVVLDVEQAGEDGGSWRMEIGELDLDRDRLFVRVRDHPAAPDGGDLVMIAGRTVFNVLERFPEDYRSRRIVPIAAPSVVAFRRTGRAWADDLQEVVDLDLAAEQEGGRWRRIDPPRVTLDPSAVGIVALGACNLRATRFRADGVTEYSDWGLDQPRFSLELSGRDGDEVVLHFGYPRPVGPELQVPEVWYCRREGYAHVWEVDVDDVQLLVRPEDQLYDQIVVRAQREEVVGLEVVAGARTLSFEREGDRDSRAWTVRERLGEGEEGPAFRADYGALTDALAAVEKAQLEYPEGLAFSPEDAVGSVRVTTVTGERFGGLLGPPWRDPESGLAGRPFLRFGDELPALIGERVGALLSLSLVDLQSDQILRVRHEDLREVVLTMGERTHAYSHPDEKTWLVRGTDLDAPRELTSSLTTLLGLRAERWLQGEAAPDAGALRGVLEVRLLPRRAGEEIRLVLGLDPGGALVCLRDGRAARVSDELLAQHEAAWGAPFFETLTGLFLD